MNGEGSRKRDRQRRSLKTEHEFDWEGVRQRITAASLALENLEETSPQVLEQVWARRAERLARVPAQAEEGEQVTLVLLRLGREVYGVDVQYIFDIRPVESITRVPRVPDWVAGVVNLRGRIFSVLDLQRFLGLAREADEDGKATRYLAVVEMPEVELALLADEVLPPEQVSVSRIQEATTMRSFAPEYLRGVAERKDGGLMTVLNLPALLADKQLIVHEEIV